MTALNIGDRLIIESGTIPPISPTLLRNILKRNIGMTTCKVEGCESPVRQNGMCGKHDNQMYRHGKILERTRYDLNDIEIDSNGICTMYLYNHKNLPIAYTLFDVEDYNKVKDIKWGLSGNGYVFSKEHGYMHHMINGKPEKGFVTDHLNRNKLDNRRRNLVITTQTENNINKDLQSNNTSGHQGISYRNDTGKYAVYIDRNGKRKRLGCYVSLDEAISVRKQAELDYPTL